MKYIAFYRTKYEPERHFYISYCITEYNGSFCLESFINGGIFFEKAFIGNCGEEKAEEIAKLFAKKGVHPVHIEDIISDMMF